MSNFILMFTFCSQFLQPLIKEFSATAVNWDTAHTAVVYVFSSLVLKRKKPRMIAGFCAPYFISTGPARDIATP